MGVLLDLHGRVKETLAEPPGLRPSPEAGSAWAIPEAACTRLISQGIREEPVGLELEPRKTILFVPEALLLGIHPRRPLPMRLGPELLAARHIALVRFPPGGRGAG